MERLYTDTEININLLKDELEKNGIPALVRNDHRSSVLAGFGAPLNSVDLYVHSADFEKASNIVHDIMHSSD